MTFRKNRRPVDPAKTPSKWKRRVFKRYSRLSTKRLETNYHRTDKRCVRSLGFKAKQNEFFWVSRWLQRDPCPNCKIWRLSTELDTSIAPSALSPCRTLFTSFLTTRWATHVQHGAKEIFLAANVDWLLSDSSQRWNMRVYFRKNEAQAILGTVPNDRTSGVYCSGYTRATAENYKRKQVFIVATDRYSKLFFYAKFICIRFINFEIKTKRRVFSQFSIDIPHVYSQATISALFLWNQ